MQKLLNIVRDILPISVKRQLKLALGKPLASLHGDWSILRKVGPIEKNHVVIDIGSRNGWFFHCWKQWCPSAIVHAFEPDSAAYEKLKDRYHADSSVHLSQLGIGEKASVETFYHMSESAVSSSFLPHDPKVWQEIKYETGEIDTQELSITTLDNYVAEHSLPDIHLIKIDIQGYELKALQGAKNTLQKTAYLLVESAIQPLYKDAANFGQVHEFMVENGFHLMDFRAWHRGNHKLMEADLLFRRNDLMPPIDDNNDTDRYYIGTA